MAQKIQVILVDDIDGGAAEETVTFGLDGVTYEIDLSAKNAKKFRDALAPYVAEARKAPSRQRRTSGSSSRRRRTSGSSRRQIDLPRGASDSDIRDWARENGYEVSDRGEVSKELRTLYEFSVPGSISAERLIAAARGAWDLGSEEDFLAAVDKTKGTPGE